MLLFNIKFGFLIWNSDEESKKLINAWIPISLTFFYNIYNQAFCHCVQHSLMEQNSKSNLNVPVCLTIFYFCVCGFRLILWSLSFPVWKSKPRRHLLKMSTSATKRVQRSLSSKLVKFLELLLPLILLISFCPMASDVKCWQMFSTQNMLVSHVDNISTWNKQ